ncbi:MAG: alanine--tRNA ligase [Desulfobacterales bacterium]|jgi:alanyl-tRNA synthetase|nr:alanine--tRNA ligase [Desulfobacterales bacterium]
MTGNEARSQFLDYFRRNGHQVVRSSSLVPQDDPTLLFINAGMVQFKRTFLGEEKRDYVRAVTSQKCVRAGGKHNDLENVGYTARHHTFFEMLGNFSFGDYFKERAIAFAWDLLTNGYRLPADKLWASIYLDDEEAYGLWRTVVGLPSERIVRFGEKDNFWSMGDTGPCGPCSEIIIDRGPAYGCGRPECTVGCECDRYLEIWNLVFMQFNRDAGGTQTRLPKPSIDTGMGLERIASVVQGVDTNFDTDLLRPIIARTEEMTGIGFGRSAGSDVAMKVIADHTRAAAFLIGDGVLPSNEGRGYVLRRIMRRAIRYGRQIGLDRPFLDDTLRAVFEIMKPAYPELGEAAAFILNVARSEEERFRHTLDTGLKLLTESLSELKGQGRREVPGALMFKLYDTYGFPPDIVRDVVRDEGMTLDMAGFEAAMAEQRARSRTVAAFARIGDAYKSLSASGFKTEFVGYQLLTCESRAVLLVDGATEVAAAEEGRAAELVVEATPFYAESGGQVGDVGRVIGPAGEAEVTAVVKDPTGLVIHRLRVSRGTIRKGDAVTLAVDAAARAATALNHTATHLLHAALRRVLGEHVKQAGSLVGPDRLRFDFTHFAHVAPEALEAVEAIVNAKIRENIPTRIEEMAAEEAFQSGATALFEEKYGDRVRVITLADFSKELCGGTHTPRTGDIGVFKIVTESSVAAGVRRIEALTGEGALAFIQRSQRTLQETARLLKETPEGLPARAGRLLSEMRGLEREIEQLKGRLSAASAAGSSDEIQEIAGVKVLVKRVEADSPAVLRELLDRMKERIASGVVVLGSAHDAKVMLIAGVTRDLTGRFHAGRIIQQAAAEVGGKGGGRPDMAQAGGSRPEHLDRALSVALDAIRGG